VPDAIGIDARAHLLGDHIDVVILKVLGHARNESCADCEAEQDADTADELRRGVVVYVRGIPVDDALQDGRIQHGKNLVDSGQKQCDSDNDPVIAKIAVERIHLFV